MHYEDEALACVLIAPCRSYGRNGDFIHYAEFVAKSTDGAFLAGIVYQPAVEAGTYGVSA